MFLSIKEPVNGFTHLAGALFSVAGLTLLVTLSAINATPWHVVSFSIYGSSMILLYTASSLYHLLPLSEKVTRIFRTIDHAMIYVLIAGTYTPCCLVALRGGWGWSLFGVVWGLAVLGIAFKVFWLEAPRWISTSFYVGMGWVVIVVIYPLVQRMPLGRAVVAGRRRRVLHHRRGDLWPRKARSLAQGLRPSRDIPSLCIGRQLLPFHADVLLYPGNALTVR